MENYVGIDLGVTNSAICTFDKETQQTRVWKSPEQNDVTLSTIYIDRQGNEYVGQRAFNASSRSPDNCATLFKPLMGTTTQIELSAVDRSFTPEECSAKILKTLFGYLPEEIRTSSETGTVVTVPAAFNQMQKNATFDAAEMAGIGKVELVQEPVAAVMNYMKANGGKDGIYLIYDLGDGTLDIAIAESIKKRVNILAHGGIQMCGGRDFDRTLVDNIVRPWLHENFGLPDDLAANPTFKPLLRLATWATERAKIELSVKDETIISLSEEELRTSDLNGDEIYLDIPLDRNTFDKLIEEQISETIDAAWETLSKTGYAPNEVESIVWVGEPTHYEPLRDKVSFELGIKGSTLSVNPITAYAEGASIFAESIFWSTDRYTEKERIENDRLQRREHILNTNLGKDLLHNPFYFLKATQRDNKKRIIELAEEQSLFSDSDKCRNFQDTLIFPRKRISAEIAWLPGVSSDRVYDILLLLETSAGNCIGSYKATPFASNDSLASVLSRMPYAESDTLADEVLELLISPEEHPSKRDNLLTVSKFLGFDKLSAIARTNLLAARMLRLPDYTSDIVVKWIIAIAQTFEGIDPVDVCTILNEERTTSEFPQITDISDIVSEIKNCRLYYKQVIKFALENILPIKERVKTVMMVIESVTDYNINYLPILIEDAIDSYEDGAEVFLEIEQNKLEKYDQRLRMAAEEDILEITFAQMVGEFIQIVKDWSIIAQPILLKRKRQGLRHTASHDLSECARRLAIFLFNEYDKLNTSLQILNTLKEIFAVVPDIDERITADLQRLNKIVIQRENNSQPSLFDN